MSVKNKILKANDMLTDWLNSHFIHTEENETTFSLIKKLNETTPFMTKSLSIKPWQGYTETPAFEDLGEVLADPGASVVWNNDGTVTLTSLVDANRQSWPEVDCTFPTKSIAVPGLRWLIDAEHDDQFNATILYHSPTGIYGTVNLTQLVEYKGVDLPKSRTSFHLNLGRWLIDNGHVNPPDVKYKNDLLAVATGKSYNHTIKTVEQYGSITGGASLGFTVNLDETPYLYYSINQPATSSGTTFGIYGDNPWFVFRDGTEDNNKCTLQVDDDLYLGRSNWIKKPQSGCINFKEFLASKGFDKSTHTITGLKLYGNADTNATYNYLFFGSDNRKTFEGNWGDPAVNTVQIRDAAVGGNITLDMVKYWVVGKYNATVKINNSILAKEQQ